MRIIAGDFKGRKLVTPKNYDVRPTGDKVKGSIFSMISSYICDAVVIDLFSGTGNLGLEALSRGASKAYFIDKSKVSLDIVKENIQKLGVEDLSNVINLTFDKALDTIDECVDIIFLDPPYNKGLIKLSIENILSKNKLVAEGIIVAEHSIDEIVEDLPLQLNLLKEKTYGDTIVSIYKKSNHGYNTITED